jgi:hypothetical protein
MLADQEVLHEQLKKLVPDLGVAQSIWIYDARGDVPVSRRGRISLTGIHPRSKVLAYDWLFS